MLYLIRHAHADDGDEDAVRPLSARGREEAARLGKFLKSSGALKVDEIWHSTLLRARQTAEVLAEKGGVHAPLREVAGLAPDDPPGSFARRLAAHRGDLAVVGHNPHLTSLAALLVRGEPSPPAVVFEKCAALALEPWEGSRAGGWCIAWHLAPELLRERK